ncbi:MAG: YCF48-related protein [Rubricoccaceae bacterium]|nr:YCF48-related protein [Rubricoccaceae bacterium]
MKSRYRHLSYGTACFLVATLFVSVALPASAQWSARSPIPTHLDIRGIAAPTAERVFLTTADDVFDDGGALFESSDGGTTWVQRDVPFSLNDPLNGIFFLDSQRGWAFGNENYRTVDGGDTWEELPFLGTTYFMEFYTPDFGITTGNGGAFVSRDAGTTWEVSPNDIVRFDFADTGFGLGISDTGIYRTTDTGTTLSLVYAGDARAVAFLSGSVAVGIVDGTFVYSTDGGQTWSSSTPTEGRTNLVAVSENVVLAWGRAGTWPDFDDRIFRSEDGGQTWTDLGEVMDPHQFAGAFSFAVPDNQTVVASDGAGSMYLSQDAGESWMRTFDSRGMQPSFLSSGTPVFANDQTGYFGYGDGFVIKTIDGGASWIQVSNGTGRNLADVDRFPNGDLIAVGDDGVIVTSSDNGEHWVVQDDPTTFDFAAVDVIADGEVAAVDESGQVYLSADGGVSWTATISKPTSLNPAEDIHFTSISDGWVIGQGFNPGVLWHTSDGGATWTPVPGFAGAYLAMDLIGENIWASNVTGLFYRSTDSGATWTERHLPGSSLQIQDMDFFDPDIGYAVGWWGYAARTDDGGDSWIVLPTPDGNTHLTHIQLLGPDELWVSTNEGQIYHSSTGGQSWAVLEADTPGSGIFSSITGVPGGDAWTVGFQGAIQHFNGPPPPPENQAPVASFEFTATGLSVEFQDTSTDADGQIVSWQWDFGDGNFSTEQNPTHTYASADTYWVELTVTDDQGASDDAFLIIVVQPGPGGTWGDFTEVTPLDMLWVTPQDEDFWTVATASADYDNDGDLDIAVLGFYVVYNQSVEDMLVLMTNNGQATQDQWDFDYVDIDIGDLSTGSSDMAWGDVDGDGDLDLAVGSDGETVLFSNEDGTLTATDTELPGYVEVNDQGYFDLKSISWADFDNDGDEDLLIPTVFDFDEFEFRTALMRNDGSNGSGGWIFTEADSTFGVATHAQTQWADYDGDQDLDLLIVDVGDIPDDTTGSVMRYRNDGNGVFVRESVLGSLRIAHGEASWGDYDADGDLDILVVGNLRQLDGTYTTALRVYQNEANEYSLVDVIQDCEGCGFWWDLTAATWADYDSDGDMDILLTGHYNSGEQIEGRARIFKNDGGVFASTTVEDDLPAPRASGTRGGTFSWLDIDNDGDLDYFIAGQYFVPGGNGLVEAQMHLYRNDVEGSNSAPTTPTNLMVDVGEPDPQTGERLVSLSWDAAFDDSTPVEALTYDLTLRRNGQPVSDPQRLPEPGDINAATEWVLTGLSDGEYVWTLRAVDSAFNGGGVAQSLFTIGTTTANEPDGIPGVYSFDGVYPNPFRRSATIRYGLPEAAEVDVAVYDILGRLVARLEDGQKAPGFHSINWNATGLASGSYLVRFSTDAFSATRRITLLN